MKGFSTVCVATAVALGGIALATSGAVAQEKLKIGVPEVVQFSRSGYADWLNTRNIAPARAQKAPEITNATSWCR